MVRGLTDWDVLRSLSPRTFYTTDCTSDPDSSRSLFTLFSPVSDRVTSTRVLMPHRPGPSLVSRGHRWLDDVPPSVVPLLSACFVVYRPYLSSSTMAVRRDWSLSMFGGSHREPTPGAEGLSKRSESSLHALSFEEVPTKGQVSKS